MGVKTILHYDVTITAFIILAIGSCHSYMFYSYIIFDIQEEI